MNEKSDCFDVDYRAVINQINSAIIVYEKVTGLDDFTIVSVNRAAEKIQAVGQSQVLGKKLTQIFPQVGSSGFLEALLSVWSTGEPQTLPVSLGHETHAQSWCDNYIYRISSGQVVAVCTDVTSQKNIESELLQSNTRLQSIERAAPIGMGVVRERTILEVNEVFCQMIGYEQDDLIGRDARIVYPDDETYRRVGEIKHPQIAATGTGAIETEMLTSDGRRINVILSSTPVNIDEPNNELLFTVQDISCRIRSERLISNAKEEWERTFDTMTDMVSIHDTNKKIVRVNKAAADFVGLQPSEMIGQNYCELFWDNFHGAESCELVGAINRGAREIKTVEHKHRGRFFSISISPLHNSGEEQQYIHVTRDITTQKQQGQIFDARFRLSQVPDELSVTDFLKLMLTEVENLTGSRFSFFYCAGDGKGRKSLFVSSRTGRQSRSAVPELFSFAACDEIIQRCIVLKKTLVRDNTPTSRSVVSCPHSELRERDLVVPIIRDNATVAVVGVSNKATDYSPADKTAIEQLADLAWDIVTRKKAVEELKKNEEQLESFIDATPDSICFKDGQGRWLKANQAQIMRLKLQGVDYVGKTDNELLGLIDPDYREALKACNESDEIAWNSRKEYHCSYAVKTSGGVKKHFDLIKKPLFGEYGERKGLIVLGRDVSEQMKLHEEASRSSRLAAIGELAAGVAHEINNPNALALYNSELLETIFDDLMPILDIGAPELEHVRLGGLPYAEGVLEIKHLLPLIKDSAKRIKRIVDDLRDFARQDQESAGELIDINQVVQASLRLTQNTIKQSTDCLVVKLSASLLPVLGEKSRIEQVVINLLVNACQALNHRSQAITVITEKSMDIKGVDILIRDEGCGIAEEDIERILEPFMTTKRETGGTGLGLSVSSRIVHEHGGELTIDSEEGVGTTVKLTFPAAYE